MIRVGEVFALKGASPAGTATITRRQKSETFDFFWAKVDWPGYRYSGQEFPFSKEGKYHGSVAWIIPDLNMELEEVPL